MSGSNLESIVCAPTGFTGGSEESWLVRYDRASCRCLSDLEDEANDKLCLNCWTTSGAVVDSDCCPTTMAFDLKLVSVKLDALGFVFPTLYFGF